MQLEQLEAYLSLLGLAPGAPLEQVREAYKHSLQVFHPDKHPAGSGSQKWASERLLVIKDAYEKLMAFYKENPSGEPTGGQKSDEQTDSIDWQQWETDQQGSFAEEVRAWEERQRERENVKLDEHGKTRRSKTLAFTKYAGVAILACLWLGKCTNNQWENASRAQEAADWKARWEYQIETQGTSYSPNAINPEILAGQAREEAERLKQKWTQEDFERNAGLFFLWVLTGGGAWLAFAARPKAIFSNWVETGELDSTELKAAAKDAAMQARAKAEIAAKKAVEAAEKLKAEAAKRMEETPIEVPLDPPQQAKPTSEEIIAAAAKERERMEAEAKSKRKRSKSAEPVTEPVTESEKPKRTRKKRNVATLDS